MNAKIFAILYPEILKCELQEFCSVVENEPGGDLLSEEQVILEAGRKIKAWMQGDEAEWGPSLKRAVRKVQSKLDRAGVLHGTALRILQPAA
jgi:hypothetical protein